MQGSDFDYSNYYYPLILVAELNLIIFAVYEIDCKIINIEDMYQVVQYQKSGEMIVENLPAPKCIKGGVLIRTYNSLISAGTEKTSVTNAQSSLLSRAKKQPEQVKLVLDFVKKEGIMAAINKVRDKLDSYKSLGYSSAGVVIESDCPEFSPGDRVAAAGAGFALHAEIITVPKNLVAHVPDNVELSEAAFTTLGSIALQGVRQAEPQLGENIAVIGLGLLGQITVQLLKANGCRVIGMDVNPDSFVSAKKFGCDECFVSSSQNIKSMLAFSGGIGFDSVIITASTSSSQPADLAMKIARKRGKIVVVGAIGMNLQRSPFYEKELEFKISCSYGPGRYDANYEILGQDYPAGYVRWTENRNMQAILSLISQKKLDVKSLTTHTFDIKSASNAYQLITGKSDEKFLGVLLSYPHREGAENPNLVLNKNYNKSAKAKIGFIGAGIFGQNYLLPALKKTDAELIGVTTSSPVNALSVAKKFEFPISSTDSLSMINDAKVNCIFCASRHDSHANYVIEAVKAGKPIFVEKPLAINGQQLVEIDEVVAKHNGRVMVGFNRRFSKSFEKINEFFNGRTDPMAISYRVNAGTLPKTYWLYEPGQGNGRIIGEACHFIDCMVYLTKALPVSVTAYCLSTNNIDAYNYDNSVIIIKFSDGSVGSLQYFANGDTSYPKEYCEVFCENSIAIMNNFEEVKLTRAGKTKVIKMDAKKGHNEEVAATIKAISEGKEMPISYKEIRATTIATFAAMESISKGVSCQIG